MHFLFLALLLLLPVNLCASSTAKDFRIGEYRALSLFGEARIVPGVEYVSFTGDYGFDRLPSKDALERHIAQESALLANFHLRIINLEFMLPGISGREQDREIDRVTIDLMKRTGYNLVSRANNHAMDYGHEGVAYNTRLLQEAGFPMVGPRSLPVYKQAIGGRTVAVFALTDYTDRPDAAGLILNITDADLQLIKTELSDSDFRIAFVHLGSMSFYPSPHERAQVARILEAGADLVVCTGSHFTKGFVYKKGKPVVYDIGNHLLSFKDSATELIGMYFVAGFKHGKLVQLFVVPFHNAVFDGKTGPLTGAELASFNERLLDRSTSDPNRYYTDPSSLAKLKERLDRFDLDKLKEMRPRYVVYGLTILYHHYPVMFVVASFLVLVLVVASARWMLLRRRTRSTRRLARALNA
jgi:hypothetical protein